MCCPKACYYVDYVEKQKSYHVKVICPPSFSLRKVNLLLEKFESIVYVTVMKSLRNSGINRESGIGSRCKSDL